MMMIKMITINFIMIMIDNIHIIIGPYMYINYCCSYIKEQRFSCMSFIILSTLSYI